MGRSTGAEEALNPLKVSVPWKPASTLPSPMSSPFLNHDVRAHSCAARSEGSSTLSTVETKKSLPGGMTSVPKVTLSSPSNLASATRRS